MNNRSCLISLTCLLTCFLLPPSVAADLPQETLPRDISIVTPQHAGLLLSMDSKQFPPYLIFVRSDKFRGRLQGKYDRQQIRALMAETAETRHLPLTEKRWGTFIKAASFESETDGAGTHYDAVWLRDSLWAYLALNTHPGTRDAGKKVLLTLWDYLATPSQIARMDRVIADPRVLDAADGQMQAVHIRFDSMSPDFTDVMENGEPQPWNHKQNDALGLFLDLLVRAVTAGDIRQADWRNPARLDAVIKLVAYFDRSQFHMMPDSGAWEEEARLNTSSVALVTSGLERLSAAMDSADNHHAREFSNALRIRAQKLGLSYVADVDKINSLVNKGYYRIIYQLSSGGESPDYRATSNHYRTADAALLNLIYPAQLERLSLEQKKQVLALVRTLAGEFGIRRYLKDNYQSANFWFHDIKTDTSSTAHQKRLETFIPFTEAQWFFDSWYATASALLYQESRDKFYLNEAVQFMNRSLAQITGKGMKGADGAPVPPDALPESTNFLVSGSRMQPVPSPITPLNWARASMTLMFNTLEPLLPEQQEP